MGHLFKLKSIPGQEEGSEVTEMAPGLRLFLECSDSLIWRPPPLSLFFLLSFAERATVIPPRLLAALLCGRSADLQTP